MTQSKRHDEPSLCADSRQDTAYLTFGLDVEASAGRKTEVWRVAARRDGSLLGTIKWFGRWRQYAFFPEPETLYNPDCLDSICAFIRVLMERRRT